MASHKIPASVACPQSPTCDYPILPADFKMDVEQIAEQAESSCEFDPKGGPPVVVVNWAGAAVIASTFVRELLWAGTALTFESSNSVLIRLVDLYHRYPRVESNLGKLINDLVQAFIGGCIGDGIAIVCSDAVAPARLKRTKCEERGHLIQHGILRVALSRGCGVGWYEKLYNRPEAQLFIEALRRNKQTLYDIDNKILIVNELAMKINNGEWREYAITERLAKVWLTAYFRKVKEKLGVETLLTFRPILLGRISKAAFDVARLS